MMRIIDGTVSRAKGLGKHRDLSRDGKKRLAWFDYYEGHGRNASLTCRYYGISRQTFYKWKGRYDPRRLESLEEKSHRPRRVRQPTWSRELAQAVLEMRETWPRWGKDKLVVLLREKGWAVSTSMVGRILKALKERGALREPSVNGVSARKRMRKLPYAVRKPKGYSIAEPGDLVEVDTLDLRPLPGVILKHFTARDLSSRWDMVGVYIRATAVTATSFLEQMRDRMPFKVSAIQVDGGSEFCAQFEDACKELGIRLFVLPPRSPKLNGHVERAQRTHTEEFYEIYDGDLAMEPLNHALRNWETVYNTVRPHQSLGYLTPLQFLHQRYNLKKDLMCH